MVCVGAGFPALFYFCHCEEGALPDVAISRFIGNPQFPPFL
jgi:hypothetical protein